VRKDLKTHDITVYLPNVDDEDELQAAENQEIEVRFSSAFSFIPVLAFSLLLLPLCSRQATVPFAVVGCNKVIEVGGRSLRGRSYPWGVVEGERDIMDVKTILLSPTTSVLLTPQSTTRSTATLSGCDPC
jgi:septin family protein